MKKDDFEYLLQLLKNNAGWEFDESKYFILDKKIYNLVREKGYNSSEDLLQELRKSPKSLTSTVVESLAMSDTCFFRDYPVFKSFEDYVLPKEKEINRGTKNIRILSLGCSTGQEVYSIAFMVKNNMVNLENWNIDIIGTDISFKAIAKAKKGAYSQFEVQMGLNARTIIENFDLTPDGFSDETKFEKDLWQVKPDIMKMVEFKKYNILDDMAFLGEFDIIFCRNVLRFFDKENQAKIIEKIYNQQSEGGFLFLGLGEQVENMERFYNPVQGLRCLYKAKTKISAKSNELKKSPNEMPSFHRPKDFG